MKAIDIANGNRWGINGRMIHASVMLHRMYRWLRIFKSIFTLNLVAYRKKMMGIDSHTPLSCGKTAKYAG